jgi:NADH-quinone oxidoreductase subunit N
MFSNVIGTGWVFLPVEITLGTMILGLMAVGVPSFAMKTRTLRVSPLLQTSYISPHLLSLCVLILLAVLVIGIFPLGFWENQTMLFGYHNLGVDQCSGVAKIGILCGLLGCFGIGSAQLQNRSLKSLEPLLLLLLSGLGMICVISSQDWITFFLSFELQSLSFYVLAGLQRHSGFSTEATLKYFILGAFSSCLLLLGISLVYGSTGTMSLEGTRLLLSQEGAASIPVHIGIFLIVITLLFKLAGAPFHMWSPDVYEGAPSFVSAVFAVVPKLALTLLMFKILHMESHACSGWLNIFLLNCGVASMIVGSFLALIQTRLKRLLAYSGISHVGYLLIGMATDQGITATFVYVVIYMVTALFLWGFLLGLKNKSHLLQVKHLSDTIGLGNSYAILGLSLSVVLFSLGGIPPLGGFFAKLAIFFATMEAGFYLPSIVAVLTSVLATYYYIRLVKCMFFEKGVTSYVTQEPMLKAHGLTLGLCVAFLGFFCCFPNILFLGASCVTSGISL